jgi:hypothetical protein
MSETTKAGGGAGGPYAGMSYEELLANPPTGFLRKRSLAKPKPKAVFVEVSARMHAAVRARPEKLRMIAEDAQGNAVIEKPAAAGNARTKTVKWGEPLRESELGKEEYERRRTQPGQAVPASGSQSPPDQQWKRKRGWDGSERYVPDTRGDRADAMVVSDYDIFAVLKE